jgi:TatD DNase family protein
MSMKIVDVHCHLESLHFRNDLDGLIEESRRAGIVKLITASIAPDQWELSTQLAARYPEVECALGVHPWYILESHRADLHRLVDARAMGAVAIGEIGLDCKTEVVDFGLQVEFFEKQLAIARKIGLPVIVHCRGAFNELMRSVRKGGPLAAGGVIHSYSGSPELTDDLIELGFSFSMGGILTFRNSPKRAAVLKKIYPGRFLLETDSPDIPPVQKRGEVNRPSYIRYSLEAAAGIIGESEAEIASCTTRNAAELFKLKV